MNAAASPPASVAAASGGPAIARFNVVKAVILTAKAAFATVVLATAYVLAGAPLYRLASQNSLVEAAVGRPRAIEIWEFAYAPMPRLLNSSFQKPLLFWASVWNVEPAFLAYSGHLRVSNNLRRIGLPLHGPLPAMPAPPAP